MPFVGWMHTAAHNALELCNKETANLAELRRHRSTAQLLSYSVADHEDLTRDSATPGALNPGSPWLQGTLSEMSQPCHVRTPFRVSVICQWVWAPVGFFLGSAGKHARTADQRLGPLSFRMVWSFGDFGSFLKASAVTLWAFAR